MSADKIGDDEMFMRESWVMKFADTYSSFLSRGGYSGWNTPTSYAEAAIFSRRKNSKRMAVHADYYYGEKRAPQLYTKLTYFQSHWMAHRCNIYDTFRENVGSSRNYKFIVAGFIYRLRKNRKLYTYKFVRGYARGWGYDLR